MSARASTVATMRPITSGSDRRLLCGQAIERIDIGTFLVLVRTGDVYRLVAITRNRPTGQDVETLASFIAPRQVDEIAASEAVSIADAAIPRETSARAKP